MTAVTQAHRDAIVAAALRMGDLRVLMTRTQLQALGRWNRSDARTFVVDCSRRWGKTVFASLLTYMQAISRPRSILRYVAPTKLHGRQFVAPTFAWLDAQLPEEFRPALDRQDQTWRWSNGSVCHLGSAETMGDVEAQVGTECHFAVIDEAGKIRADLLRHLHRSVLRAQFLTTGGRCLIPSTPAISPAHYLSELVATAQAANALARFTIDDCDHVPIEERESMIRDLGGRDSTEVRRELYCEHVAERSRLIVPEWQDAHGDCVAAVDAPRWRDWYCAADFGFHDLSVLLWAWFDFANSRIVVEHELAMHQASGLDVGFAAKAIEEREGLAPRLRVADAPVQMLADIINRDRGPGLTFSPALKDDADAALNQLRMLIQQRRIVINPRCTTLISHLAYGTWNERRTSFDRAEGFGHWDAIDALKYLVRAVNWRSNPTPTIDPSTDMNHFAAHPSLRRTGTRRTLNGARS